MLCRPPVGAEFIKTIEPYGTDVRDRLASFNAFETLERALSMVLGVFGGGPKRRGVRICITVFKKPTSASPAKSILHTATRLIYR